MRVIPTLLLPVIAGSLAACAGNGESMGRMGGAPPRLMITTELLSAGGESLGKATLAQEADGVRVTAAVSGLAAGSYAVHLHAVGKCEGPDFTSAGGHFNPAMKQHGRLNPAGEHSGDLPNITVGDDRKGTLDALRPGLRLVDGDSPLLDADGAAVVLHAQADDYRSDPAGNAGARIACGVVVMK